MHEGKELFLIHQSFFNSYWNDSALAAVEGIVEYIDCITSVERRHPALPTSVCYIRLSKFFGALKWSPTADQKTKIRYNQQEERT